MKIFSLFFAVLLLVLHGTSGKSCIKSKKSQGEDCQYGESEIEMEIKFDLVPFCPRPASAASVLGTLHHTSVIRCRMGLFNALNPPALENRGM